MKYSICSTVYNSEEVVDLFLSKFLNTDYEIIVVDGGSTDNTGKLLENYYDRIKLLNKKCTRGRGRELAIKYASGDNIILIDFDVEVLDLKNIVDTYEKNYEEEKIHAIHLIGSTCNPNIFIGRKELFVHMDAWPDLNCFEDQYFESVCKSLNAFKFLELTTGYNCMQIKHTGPGRESRYENSILKQIKRRIICAGNALFVAGYNFKDLMKYYKITGFKRIYVGLPEYILAWFYSRSIKVQKIPDKVRELKSKN